MPLTLRVKAGRATFAMTDGVMKAEWTLTTDMDEDELMDALMGMLRYVRQQPAADTRPPLHVVPDTDDANVAEYTAHQRLRRDEVSLVPPQPMTWRPAVAPKPLDASIEAAQAGGFELIPDDEMGD